MKIGILGGAFNPPHIGHITLAQEVLETYGLDKIFFIPTNVSPHKEGDKVSALMRFKMLELAINQNSEFEVLDLEIKRGGTSYTIDTLQELKNRYPEDEFYLVIGSDLANDFLTWKDADQIKKIVKIAVACRSEYPLKEKDGFFLFDITHIELSSSAIRARIKQGLSVAHLVQQEVLDFIVANKLYV